MADKTSVQVNKFAVKSIFDAAHKAKATAAMQKAAEGAVKSSGKLALGKPAKGAKGWILDGSLTSLSPDKAGKKLEAKCSMSISSSTAGIKAMPSGTAAIAIASSDKVDAGDVEAVTDGCVAAAMKSALKFMESTAP